MPSQEIKNEADSSIAEGIASFSFFNSALFHYRGKRIINERIGCLSDRARASGQPLAMDRIHPDTAPGFEEF